MGNRKSRSTYEKMENTKGKIAANRDGIDKLTGLYNREYTLKEVKDYLNEHRNTTFAIYVMDIDNFQIVDDNLGRVFGNEIIKELAETIERTFSAQDIIGRVGGDQFLICQKNYESIEKVIEKSEELCAGARNIYKGEIQDINTSLSIGIALGSKETDDTNDYVRCARKALAYAKNSGKDRYAIYNDGMKTQKPEISELDFDNAFFVSKERRNMEYMEFDSFGYKLVNLAFNLMEESSDVKNAINLLLRKVGMHYNLSNVLVRELSDKPRTMRCTYEYSRDESNSGWMDVEWNYDKEDWKRFKKHFEGGYYLFYKSEGIPFYVYQKGARVLELETYLQIPIVTNGQIIGCIDYVSVNKEIHFSDQDLSTLKIFTRLISTYLLNLRNYYNTTLKIEKLNDYDTLTSLMKYNVFYKKLEDAMKKLKKDNNIIIMYSDLRHFKYINETYGYDVGNNLLKMFCNYMVRDVRGLIGGSRVYSDNIVVAAECPKWYTDEQVYHRIELQNEELNRKLQDQFMDNNINVCTGIFIIKDSKMDIEMAISNANMARKEAKKKERDTVVLFDDEMMQSVVRQMQLNTELPWALKNGNIKVYYQPKTESGTGKIVGAEALVRWKKDDGTFIYPDEFISGFEENGLIVEVDYFVYENVFRSIKKRLDKNLSAIPISMNISRVHLKEGEFLDYIDYLFDKYPIPAEYVEFELTESIYIDNMEKALELIRGLRRRGIKIAMDDFGSGYSSLNLLNNLPIDILKLDKIFLNGEDLTPNQKIIISCIVEMASKMDIRVVCEGVETMEQVSFLTVIGCDMIQGYYYAKPMPEDEFCRYMDKHIKVHPVMVCFSFDGTLQDTQHEYTGYCMGGEPEYGEGPFVGTKALLCRGGDIMSHVINIPRDICQNSSFTISLWAKVINENRWSSLVLLEYENGFHSIMSNAGDMNADYRIKNGNEDEDIWHDSKCDKSSDQAWHFYTATYNAQTEVGMLYMDGVIVGYMENVSMLTRINRILIGGDPFASPFEGLISRVRFHNQPLSKRDVQILYWEDEKQLKDDVRKSALLY